MKVVAGYQVVLLCSIAGEEWCITVVPKLCLFCILSAFYFINSVNEKQTLCLVFSWQQFNGGRQQAWRQLKNVQLLYKMGHYRTHPGCKVADGQNTYQFQLSLGLFPELDSYYTAHWQYFMGRGQYLYWTNDTQQTWGALLPLCPPP